MTDDRAPAPSPGAASVPDDPRADTWLERFCRLLAAPEARHFATWAARSAGPRIVLERQQFEPADLKPWLGAISILQWDADRAGYRYRLFGTKWIAWCGRDLTGQTPTAWLDDTAEEVRLRLDGVATRHTPVGARLLVQERADGWAKRERVLYEQVLCRSRTVLTPILRRSRSPPASRTMPSLRRTGPSLSRHQRTTGSAPSRRQSAARDGIIRSGEAPRRFHLRAVERARLQPRRTGYGVLPPDADAGQFATLDRLLLTRVRRGLVDIALRKRVALVGLPVSFETMTNRGPDGADRQGRRRLPQPH